MVKSEIILKDKKGKRQYGYTFPGLAKYYIDYRFYLSSIILEADLNCPSILKTAV